MSGAFLLSFWFDGVLIKYVNSVRFLSGFVWFCSALI